MRGQLTLCRSRDLAQLPTAGDRHCALVLARMPRTELCEVCTPLGEPPTLEQSANSEVVLGRPAFLPMLFDPLHLHDAPPSQRLLLHGEMPLQLVPHGMLLSVDATSGLQPCLPVVPRQRTQLFNLRDSCSCRVSHLSPTT